MLYDNYISAVTLTTPIDNRSYLYNLPAVNYLRENKLRFTKNVTFFVGENGAGKSTLIEAIATAFGFNPEGGTRNFNFSTNKSHSTLWQNLTLSKNKLPKDGFFLRAESFYNVASNIEEIYGGELSSGVEIGRAHV